LEKWFDDIHAESKKEEQVQQEIIEEINEEPSVLTDQTEPVTASQNITASVENKEVSESKINLSVLEKFKSIKLKKISFDKKDLTKKISVLAKK
jgi:hypothetical protein